QAGLQIFRGKAHCTACHVGPTFTDERTHNTGIAWDRDSAGFRDAGRGGVTGKPADLGAFKTPNVRGGARTGPDMHDGSLSTLSEVIDYYDRGGNLNPLLDPEIHPLGLGAAEKRALAAFLQSLSASTLAEPF